MVPASPPPALPQVQVGHTDVYVSRMGLGTAPLGRTDPELPDEQALATVRAALDAGITFIDTAPLYGAGLSERRLGQVLAERPRTSYVLATKVGRLVADDGTVSFDFSRDGVLRSLEASLQRLGLDYVDILHIHDPDDHYQQALDEAFPTLADLRSQGVVRAIGSGMNQWQMFESFIRNADFNCFLLAGRYTLLEQTAVHSFLPLCQERHISVFLGGVYNSGILASGSHSGATYNYAPPPPEVQERVAQIEATCARHNVPLNVAALQFPLAHPAVTSLLVGAVTPDEVQANLDVLHRSIPPALWDDLRAEGLIDAAAPTPNS